MADGVTQRKSGSGKKVVLLVVWLALLGGLFYWIKTAGGSGGETIPGRPPQPKPAPTLNTAMLEAKWPQIVAHAAAPARGAANAPYTIAEFGDFQCPQCGKVYPVIESVLKKYPAQVNLLFLHRPIPSIHQWAIPAGQASLIAAQSGKFWPMYDLLYTHQDDLETGFYGGYAAQAGLNESKFKAAFSAGQGQSQLQADTKFADALGVEETPTILLRDNKAKTVTVFVGTTGTQQANGSPQYPGVNNLAANPPWGK